MKNSISDNPELKRNIWLELTSNRLIVMPLVLAAIFYLTYLSGETSEEFMERLRNTSMIAFGLIVIIWGTKLVSESVITEVNEKTWDSQRMTSVSPLDMSIGKLLGSALYPWYGGLFCIIAYLISALYLPDTSLSLKYFLMTILVALLGHSFSLILSLMEIRKCKDKEKIKASSYFLAGIILSFFFIFFLSGIVRETTNMSNWYGLHFSPSDFMLFSVIFFLAWSVIGVYRNMRAEFQMTNGPYIWLAFLISLMLYVSGVIAGIEDMERIKYFVFALYASYMIGIFFTYLTAFIEPKQIVEFRLLTDKARKRQWTEFGDNLPLWIISLGVTMILCAKILVLSLLTTPIEIIKGETNHLPAFYALNVLCFMGRDLSILLFVNLKKDAKRADIAAFVYLAILYGLLPSILAMSGLKDLLPIVAPMFESNPINGTIPILIQCAVMFFLLLNRWKARNMEYKKGGSL